MARGLVALALVAALVGCGAAQAQPPRVLVVTEARRYVHASIPDAVAALRRLGRRDGYRIEVVGAASRLTPARLRGARVVAFVSTTGELHGPGPARLLAWIRRGGAFLGLHSVTATWRREGEFHRMLGATFRRHPRGSVRRVVVEDRHSPLTRGLPPAWRTLDEFYEFTRDPRPRVHVLVRLGGSPDRPLVWCRRYGRGRVFVDSLGHFPATWSEPTTLTLISGGLRWALGRTPAPRCR